MDACLLTRRWCRSLSRCLSFLARWAGNPGRMTAWLQYAVPAGAQAVGGDDGTPAAVPGERMEVSDDATRSGTQRMQSGAALLALRFGSNAGRGATCGQRAVTLGRVPPLACALPRLQPRAAR
jgi:hypothetical protein